MKIRSGKYKGKKVEWVVNNDIQYAQNLSTDIGTPLEVKRAIRFCIDKKS